MAQTGYTPISIYYSSTASAVPTAANLVPGELAINTNDGKLYYEDSAGVVRVLATKSTGTIGGSTTQVQYNSSGSLAGSANFVWDNANTRLGIGTASPTARLNVVTASDTPLIAESTGGSAYVVIKNSSSTAGAGIASTGDNLLLFTSTSGTERMRIDSSSGNVLVGTTSSIGGKLQVLFDGTSGDGIVLKTNNATLDATFIRFLNSAGSTAGNIYQNGTTTVNYATSSDYRLKENIVPMTSALAKVAQLKPVTYKWKSDGSDGQGFIAHELQSVVPDCVTGKKDAIDADGKPVYQGIDTSFLVATLTKAIQEQQALIESLTTRLSALENK